MLCAHTITKVIYLGVIVMRAKVVVCKIGRLVDVAALVNTFLLVFNAPFNYFIFIFILLLVLVIQVPLKGSILLLLVMQRRGVDQLSAVRVVHHTQRVEI